MILSYRSIKDREGSLAADFVSDMIKAFGLKIFVETGTYQAVTLSRMAPLFEALYSVELSDEHYLAAAKRFAASETVHLEHGDSVEGLRRIMPRLDSRPAFFWLDAHYSGGDTARGEQNSPISGEVDVVLGPERGGDVIVVDDIRNFCAIQEGFLTHEALGGYPLAADVARQVEGRSGRYGCCLLPDALVAFPTGVITLTPVLSACTDSRLGRNDDLQRVEATIADAEGSERDALLDIPAYLVDQSLYGLGGHYFYWRALVRQKHGLSGAEQDADIARRTGVLPPGSRLS